MGRKKKLQTEEDMIKYLNSLLDKNGGMFKEYEDKMKDFFEKKEKSRKEREARFGGKPMFIFKKIDESSNQTPLDIVNQKPSDNNSKENEKKEKDATDKKKILDKYSKHTASGFWRKDMNN